MNAKAAVNADDVDRRARDVFLTIVDDGSKPLQFIAAWTAVPTGGSRPRIE